MHATMVCQKSMQSIRNKKYGFNPSVHNLDKRLSESVGVDWVIHRDPGRGAGGTGDRVLTAVTVAAAAATARPAVALFFDRLSDQRVDLKQVQEPADQKLVEGKEVLEATPNVAEPEVVQTRY